MHRTIHVRSQPIQKTEYYLYCILFIHCIDFCCYTIYPHLTYFLLRTDVKHLLDLLVLLVLFYTKTAR